MLDKCPECHGKLVQDKFEVVCKRCGLVIEEPVCIRGVVVFGY